MNFVGLGLKEDGWCCAATCLAAGVCGAGGSWLYLLIPVLTWSEESRYLAAESSIDLSIVKIY